MPVMPSPQTSIQKKNLISQTKTYVMGAQKNHLIEMVLLSTPNLCLKNHSFKCKNFANQDQCAQSLLIKLFDQKLPDPDLQCSKNISVAQWYSA